MEVSKHLRYYYEVHLKGKRSFRKNHVSSDDIKPSKFPHPHKKRNRLHEEKAVMKFLGKHLPKGITIITDCKIERHDQYDDAPLYGFGVVRTARTLICKWKSLPLFVLNRNQKQVFKVIENQLPTIALKWNEWKRLFANEEGLQLCQKTAPTFFSLARESMMHDVIQSIQRLFDRDVVCKSETCSFTWLAKNIDLKSTKNEFDSSLSKLRRDLRSLKRWRDKVISHTQHTHKGKKQKVRPIRHQQIDEALKNMSSLVNIIAMNIKGNEEKGFFAYNDVVSRRGANDLIHYLKRGVKDREDSLQRFRDRTKNPHLEK